MSKRKRSVRPPQKRYLDERATDVMLWLANGCVSGKPARVQPCREVSVGRTNSKRGLGFIITKPDNAPDWGWEHNRGRGVIDFVLDKDQVAELAAYMQHCVYLLDPPGRKRKQNGLSFVAMNTPKQRLFQELESAAKKAHPTYREIEVDEGMFEIEGEPKEGLVAWFKKNRPKQAARIERAFTKRLWAGKP